jgi:hypothetical protein
VKFEKIVRPAQEPNVRPPRQSTKRGSSKDAVITLKIDLAGGGNLSTLSGSFSQTTSFYVEAYVNESTSEI